MLTIINIKHDLSSHKHMQTFNFILILLSFFFLIFLKCFSKFKISILKLHLLLLYLLIDKLYIKNNLLITNNDIFYTLIYKITYVQNCI